MSWVELGGGWNELGGGGWSWVHGLVIPSFKTKSDIFLTPIPLWTSFILTQISPAVSTVKKSTFAFLYPSADITYISYIQKKKDFFFWWHKVLNNFWLFSPIKITGSFFNSLIFIFSNHIWLNFSLKSKIRLLASIKLIRRLLGWIT